MITPALHKVHHAINPEYIDKNCGGTLNIWDRMFGTFQPQIKGVPLKLGLLKKYNSSDPFLVNILPFHREKKVRESINNNFIFYVASIMIFSVLINFIYLESIIPLYLKICLFLSIFASTFAVGGMLRFKRWAFNLWIFICVFYNWGIIYWFEIKYLGLIISFVILSLFTVFIINRYKKSHI